MHLVRLPVPPRCRGDPLLPPILPADSGRKRPNISGAYNPDTYSEIRLTGEENRDAPHVIGFSDPTPALFPSAPSVTIFADNAKCFRAKTVGDRTEDHPRLNIIFLPSYAPNPNPNLIERFRKFAKKKLADNKYY